MSDEETEEHYWLSVIGKSLAYLCLHVAELRTEDLASQEAFLQRFGLTRQDCATILNTTTETLRVAAHRVKRAKKAKRGSKTKGKGKTKAKTKRTRRD